MAYNDDWMPGPRSEMLAMCRNWINYMTAERRTAWGVPAAEFTELGTLFGAAQTLLQKATDEDERTRVITVECQAAFKALEAKMRFFRNRYFKPLDGGDWAALGFRQRDLHHSPIPAPESQVEADLTFPGIHMVELRKIRPVSGTAPDARSDYGTRIYYGLSGPPSDKYRFRLTEAPKTGGDLPYSLFTRRKNERFDFDGESGNRVYFCLRYENSKGEAGPFGPIFSAVIP
jgi:hypothetical protein